MADYTLSCDSSSLDSTLSIIYYISVYVKGFFNKNQNKTHIYLCIIKFRPRPLAIGILAICLVRVIQDYMVLLFKNRCQKINQISLAIGILAKR